MAKISGLRSGGNRKIGRNKAWCESYRRRHQRERNKIRKIRKHLKYFSGDKQSKKRLVELRVFVALRDF